MTFKNKLSLIVNALAEAQQATIGSAPTLLFYRNSNNDLESMQENEVRHILDYIETQTHTIHVYRVTNRLLSINEQPKNPGYILVDILDGFNTYKLKFINQKKSSPITTFDNQSGILIISGKSLKLRANTFRSEVIKLLLKNNQNKRKEWSWGEVIDHIVGSENDKALRDNNKHKFYPACRGLNQHIESKIQIHQFLNYSTKAVSINSKYL